MTTLSWLIYIVFVGERFHDLFGALFFVVAVFAAVRGLFICGPGTEIHVYDEVTGERSTMARTYRFFPMWLAGPFIFICVMFFLVSFIPDMTTALAIAGVELGNEALQSEYVQDFIKDYTNEGE